MDLSKYLGPFLDESRENLQSLNCYLLELEKRPQDENVINEIFRIAHSLKGMSATMGFNQIAQLTHQMETALDQIRKGDISVSTSMLDLLFECLDSLEKNVNGISESGEEQDTSGLKEKLSEVSQAFAAEQLTGEPFKDAEEEAEVVKSEEKVMFDDGAKIDHKESERNMSDIEFNEYEKMVMTQASQRGWFNYRLDVALAEGCLMKAARAYMVVKKLEDFGELIKSEPPIEELEAENFGSSFVLFILSLEEGEKIRDAVASISEVEDVHIKALDLQDLSTYADKETPTPSLEAEKTEKKILAKHKKAVQTVRVDIERLDSLMNLMGELVIQRTRLVQIGLSHRLKDLNETVEHIGRITTDLQNVVMQVRMVPLEQVFTRFPRMIRDLAKEMNKQIDLTIVGQETELDRTVIDEIGDPLVHLLRNAVDHGMELPDERKKAGKNPEGKIMLSAQHEGNHVLISVQDDGRGLDTEVIRQKAVEKGIYKPKEAARISDQEAINMIFLPGFSTALKTTDLSGRGVGMDVVKNKIESLNGSIFVETEKGHGTMFIIQLPLTLAIIQALLVNVGPETYAIPLETIHETLSLMTDEIKTIRSQETILLRGNVLPLIRLSERLGAGANGAMNGSELFVVISKIGENRAGLVVDSLVGQQEIVIKSLPRLFGDIRNIAGATILGDGQVALILDVADLF